MKFENLENNTVLPGKKVLQDLERLRWQAKKAKRDKCHVYERAF